MLSGADVLVHCLLQHGVRVVFAYPGGTSMPMHQALTRVENRLRTILPRHEQGGGFAASAYARWTGQVGVCMATSGPGATNFVPCLADAMRHGIPLLTITGQVHRPAIGTDAFQEIPIVGMCRWLTKHHYQVRRPEDLTRILREAFHLATTGRPGPVLVDVPKDVQVLPGLEDQGVAMNLPGYRPEPAPVPYWCPPLSACPGDDRDDGVTSPGRVLDTLAAVLRERNLLKRVIVTSGLGPEQDWLARYFPFDDVRQWLTTSSGSAEGYALPAALGVLAAEPGRPVLAVATADNLLVNIHELACAYCENLPVKILLLSDAPRGVDFVQVCRGFRGQGREVTHGQRLTEAIEEMLAATGPYLLDVSVTPTRTPRERTPARAAACG